MCYRQVTEVFALRIISAEALFSRCEPWQFCLRSRSSSGCRQLTKIDVRFPPERIADRLTMSDCTHPQVHAALTATDVEVRNLELDQAGTRVSV